MPDRWTENRDRYPRERNWRSDSHGRGERGYREDRSFDSPRDRVFGERETGEQYNRPRYGSGEGYRSSYELDQGRFSGGGGGSPRFSNQDYTGGGRYYGDDAQEPIYREEYGQGGREYGPEPRGYDAGRRGYRADRTFGRDEGPYGNRDLEARYAPEMRHRASGGTGGYDYERGYGDGGRGYPRTHDRFEDRARDAGDMFRRAGERISSWFGGEADRFRDERGHRGRGPKNYQRPDDRISDEVHQALTEDPWVDASQVSVNVSAGEVTLSGAVENREAKHRAERSVEDIPGVKHVQNNLRVDQGSFLTSPGRGYGDSVLEAQMRKDAGAGTTPGATGEDSAATRTTTRRT